MNDYKKTCDQTRLHLRKQKHLSFSKSELSQLPRPAALDLLRFRHNALPEINFSEIDLSTTFCKYPVSAPFFISCMSGGIEEAKTLNRRLASTAQAHGIALGLGSLKVLLRDPSVSDSFDVRAVAPAIPIFGNIGATYLAVENGCEKLLQVIDDLRLDGCFVHLNPMQEIFQSNGTLNWRGVTLAIEKFIKLSPCPVVVKEVGHSISVEVAERLLDVGVEYIDVAARGGTSWIKVESSVSEQEHSRRIAEPFDDWGDDIVQSLTELRLLDKKLALFASGGIRNGLDVAKCIALGATNVGAAYPFLSAAMSGEKALYDEINIWKQQLRIAMFGVGVTSVGALSKVPLIE